MPAQKPDKLTIVDCGPRDGLAATVQPVATPDKVKLIESIAEAGIGKIECVAFHHPRINTRNADAERVMAQIQKRKGTRYLGLVPDEIGCRRALTTNIDEVVVLVAVSETFNQAMLRQSLRETLHKTLPSVFESARIGGKDITAYIQTAFGCPYTGKVEFAEVISLATRLAFVGVNRLSFADNTGMANPRQVKALMQEILALDLNVELGVHFHNPRGTALANCVAAYEAGIRHFDTAIGGLSRQLFGSPMTEIGKGNVPTEDLVFILDEMGIDTGVDMDALLRAVEMAERLCGHPLAGHILKAGPSSRLHEVPSTFSLPRETYAQR